MFGTRNSAGIHIRDLSNQSIDIIAGKAKNSREFAQEIISYSAESKREFNKIKSDNLIHHERIEGRFTELANYAPEAKKPLTELGKTIRDYSTAERYFTDLHNRVSDTIPKQDIKPRDQVNSFWTPGAPLIEQAAAVAVGVEAAKVVEDKFTLGQGVSELASFAKPEFIEKAAALKQPLELVINTTNALNLNEQQRFNNLAFQTQNLAPGQNLAGLAAITEIAKEVNKQVQQNERVEPARVVDKDIAPPIDKQPDVKIARPKEEVGKDTPKKDGPKREEIAKDEPNKDKEKDKDEPKKVIVKKDEKNKDIVKKDEPKKEEEKQQKVADIGPKNEQRNERRNDERSTNVAKFEQREAKDIGGDQRIKDALKNANLGSLKTASVQDVADPTASKAPPSVTGPERSGPGQGIA